MKKVPFIVGNWKMHKTVAETKEHLRRLKPLVLNSTAEIGLAVPYTDLYFAAQEAKDSKILIGAQNMSDLPSGSLTGEISASMIIEAGATFVILGHSERRRIFQEKNRIINRKIKLALESNLKVILCIGETIMQKENNSTESVLNKQLVECLEDIEEIQSNNISIAYEPVWAIGNEMPANPELVEEIHGLCKNIIANNTSLSVEKVRILYGGSVNVSNAENFLKMSNVEGLLIGGASLEAEAFASIVNQAKTI